MDALRPSQKLVVRRTTFVGCGFVGLRNPAAFGREPTPDDLHPFLGVVSNAQNLSESWRPVADQEFASHIAYLDPAALFTLHVGGQTLLPEERVSLERAIRRCLPRIGHPEPVARLLARAIRRVSQRNAAVGPNVMCTFVRRSDAAQWDGAVPSGLIPLVAEVQAEAAYFRRLGDGRSRYVFSPADPAHLLYYGPNFTCDGFQMTGLLFGPASLIASSGLTGPGSPLQPPGRGRR